jgi:dTDP-4-dehydrorhamnose 3,5-epimerase
VQIIETDLPGVLIVEPRVFQDQRGFFVETWQQRRYENAGIVGPFVQDNRSSSCRGTLRGLHFQIQQPQGKLVFVTRGEIFDVAVDLRVGSPHFGRWTGTSLSAENFRQVYVPPGFAHGFCVQSEEAEVFYKCTDYYAPEYERTLLWSDPEVGIEWPLDVPPILSAKDENGAPLSEVEPFGTSAT